mgnify:CR=1 FL=1
MTLPDLQAIVSILGVVILSFCGYFVRRVVIRLDRHEDRAAVAFERLIKVEAWQASSCERLGQIEEKMERLLDK